MKKPRTAVILLLSIVSVAEAGAILYLLRAQQQEEPVDVRSTPAPNPEVPALHSTVAALDVHELEVQAVRSAPPLGTSSVAVVLAELTQQGGVRASVRFLDESGRVMDSFADLFALSSEERVALNLAVESSRQRLAALLASHSRVVQQPSGEIEISIDPFEVAGGLIHDSVCATIGQILGAERMIAFTRLTGSQLDEAHDHFGASSRKLTITPTKSSDGMVSYTVLDESDRGVAQFFQSGTYTDLNQFLRRNPNFAPVLKGRAAKSE